MWEVLGDIELPKLADLKTRGGRLQVLGGQDTASRQGEVEPWSGRLAICRLS